MQVHSGQNVELATVTADSTHVSELATVTADSTHVSELATVTADSTHILQSWQLLTANGTHIYFRVANCYS